jgi:hypothetical protein
MNRPSGDRKPAASASPPLVWVALSHGDAGAFPFFASRDRDAAVRAAVEEAATFGYDETEVETALNDPEGDGSWTEPDGGSLTVSVTGLPVQGGSQ